MGDLARSLVFVDFAPGDLLQMSGEAEIDLGSPEIARLPLISITMAAAAGPD